MQPDAEDGANKGAQILSTLSRMMVAFFIDKDGSVGVCMDSDGVGVDSACFSVCASNVYKKGKNSKANFVHRKKKPNDDDGVPVRDAMLLS